MFLTFLCDINLRLIVGSALLIGLGDFCLHLSCKLHGEGQGVKRTSRPHPLAVVTSTGLLTHSMRFAKSWCIFGGKEKRKKNQTGLTFSRFSMKYQTALRQQTWYNQDTFKKMKKSKNKEHSSITETFILMLYWHTYTEDWSENKPSVFSTEYEDSSSCVSCYLTQMAF